MASVFKRGGKANRGGAYNIQWYDHTGKRRSKSARTTDKATAERIAAKLEADVALRRDGIIDPTLDAINSEAQCSIDLHLVDYEAKMKSADRDPQHVQSTTNYIRRICKTEGFVAAADINADGVIRYAGRIMDQGRSSRTIQVCLTAIKGFTRWLTQHDKLSRDPLAKVRKPNPKADRRRERRILLPEEWQWFRTTIAIRPERFGMSGADRVLLYDVAIQTGLRSNELRSLTRSQLYRDGDAPYVTCKATSTKNKKPARQYIRTETAAAPRAHVTAKAPRAQQSGRERMRA